MSEPSNCVTFQWGKLPIVEASNCGTLFTPCSSRCGAGSKGGVAWREKEQGSFHPKCPLISSRTPIEVLFYLNQNLKNNWGLFYLNQNLKKQLGAVSFLLFWAWGGLLIVPRWNLVPRPTSAPGWNLRVPGPQAQNYK